MGVGSDALTDGNEAQNRKAREEEIRSAVGDVLKHGGRYHANNAAYRQRIPCHTVATLSTLCYPVISHGTHKLLIHVQDVVIDVPVERVAILKISLGRTQPIGAHEYEKFTS